MDLGMFLLDSSLKSVFAGLCLGYLVGLFLTRNKKIDTEDNKNTEKSITNLHPTYTVALVVNSSLKMGKGKVAAQCGHAILSLVKKAKKNSKSSYEKWVEEGQDILLVSVKSTEIFDDLSQMASMESLNHYIVADAGRTQIQSGSLTVMAIGPGNRETINNIVGQLPLYL